MNVHAFTSITSNYIPKARVLGQSLKQQYPDIQFHLILNDKLDPPLDLMTEPFDSVLYLDDFPIEEKSAWIFKHSVVELCTAVKGIALLEIVRRFSAEKIFYFDPDIVIFGRVQELVDHLDTTSILLTPHLSIPETSRDAIMDNEIAALKHGVFNLGFLGVRADGEGLEFARWWADRLLQFCFDDIAGGLFTDQRWVDLVPCFFTDFHVLRSPGFNVATWNITHRHAEGSLKDGLTINGEPLGFYHFSGFDSGAQHVMLDKYAEGRLVLYELREWYEKACEASGQQVWRQKRCHYDSYDDGTIITREQRLLYRTRPDLQRTFPEPFSTGSLSTSFLHWYQGQADMISGKSDHRERELDSVRKELNMITNSRTWKLRGKIVRLIPGKR